MASNAEQDEEEDDANFAAKIQKEAEMYSPALLKLIEITKDKKRENLERIYRLLNDRTLRENRKNRALLLRVRAFIKKVFSTKAAVETVNEEGSKTAIQKCGTLKDADFENSLSEKGAEIENSLNHSQVSSGAKSFQEVLTDVTSATTKLKDCTVTSTANANKVLQTPESLHNKDGDPRRSSTSVKLLDIVSESSSTTRSFDESESRDTSLLDTPAQDSEIVQHFTCARVVDSNNVQMVEKPQKNIVTTTEDEPLASNFEDEMKDAAVKNTVLETIIDLQDSTSDGHLSSSSSDLELSPKLNVSNDVPNDNNLSDKEPKELLTLPQEQHQKIEYSQPTSANNSELESSRIPLIDNNTSMNLENTPNNSTEILSANKKVCPTATVENELNEVSSHSTGRSNRRLDKPPPIVLMPWKLKVVDLMSPKPKRRPSENVPTNDPRIQSTTQSVAEKTSNESETDVADKLLQIDSEKLQNAIMWAQGIIASGEHLHLDVDNASTKIKVENENSSESIPTTSSIDDSTNSNKDVFYRDPRPFHMIHESNATTSQTMQLLPSPVNQATNSASVICIDISEGEEESEKPKGPPLIYRKSHDRCIAMEKEVEQRKAEILDRERLASKKAQRPAWKTNHYNRLNMSNPRMNYNLNNSINNGLLSQAACLNPSPVLAAPVVRTGSGNYPIGIQMPGNMMDPLQISQILHPLNPLAAVSSRDPRLAKRANALIQSELSSSVSSASSDVTSSSAPFNYCLYCRAENKLDPELALNHYINVHPDKDPPVRLPMEQLEETMFELEVLGHRLDEKTPTGLRWLDDLSWIPVGSVFLAQQKCRGCSFTTCIRSTLLQHVQNHRQEILAPNSHKTIIQTDSMYHCRFCEMTTDNLEEFHKHCTFHTGEYLFACGGCPDYRGPTQEDVQKHIKDKHAGRNTSIKCNDKVKLSGGILYGHMCSDCLFLQLNEMKVQTHVTTAHLPRLGEAIKINMSKRVLQSRNTLQSLPLPPSATSQTSITPMLPYHPVQSAPLPLNVLQTIKIPPPGNRQFAITATRSDVSMQQTSAMTRSPLKRPPPVKIRDDPRRALGKLGDGTVNNDVTNTTSPRGKSLKAKSGDGAKVKPTKKPSAKQSRAQNKKLSDITMEMTVALPSSDLHSKYPHPSMVSANVPEMIFAEENIPLELGTMDIEVEQGMEDSNDDDLGGDPQLGHPIISSVRSERNDAEYDSDDSTDTIVMNPTTEVGATSVYCVKSEPIDFTEKYQEVQSGLQGDQIRYSVPSIADTISKLHVQLHGNTTQMPVSSVTPLSTSKSLPYGDGGRSEIRITQKQIKNWSERQKVIVCSCLFAARSTEAFVRHREHWHKAEKRCTCPECHLRFDNAVRYAEHLWTACPKTRMFACSVESLCRFTTSSPVNFVTHIKEEHIGIPWLPCYWCDSTFNTPECLVVHIQNKCSLRVPLMNALMKNSALSSASNNDECGASTSRNPTDLRHELTGVRSPEDSMASHLEIIYRCSVPQCSHQSLEREVFIDHVQVDHPEKTVHVCHDCGENFQNLLSLVVHIEKHHREEYSGRNVSDGQHPVTEISFSLASPPLLSSAPQSVPSTIRSEKTNKQMPVVGSGLSPTRQSPDLQIDSDGVNQTSFINAVLPNQQSQVTESSVPSLAGCFTDSAQADRMLTNSLAMKTSDEVRNEDDDEGMKIVKLNTVANLCKFVALTCEVMFSRNVDSSRLEEMISQWNQANRQHNGSFLIPELSIIDPLKFPLTLKSNAALSAMLNDQQGLVNLYKCPGKECQFTCTDEDEFQRHLELGHCHTTDRLLQCIYCGEENLTVWGAVAHLSQQHGPAIFQCPDCIFRSSRNLYVILHIVLEHPQHHGQGQVIKCKNPSKNNGDSTTNTSEDDLPNLLSVILPIPCTIDGCAFLTVDPLAFSSHLTTSHPGADTCPCFFCGVSFNMNELIKHLECHRIFKFHCRYCGYGTHNGNDIVIHLCCKHPHVTGRVFIREYEHQQQQVNHVEPCKSNDQILSPELIARVVANIKREKDEDDDVVHSTTASQTNSDKDLGDCSQVSTIAQLPTAATVQRVCATALTSIAQNAPMTPSSIAPQAPMLTTTPSFTSQALSISTSVASLVPTLSTCVVPQTPTIPTTCISQVMITSTSTVSQPPVTCAPRVSATELAPCASQTHPSPNLSHKTVVRGLRHGFLAMKPSSFSRTATNTPGPPAVIASRISPSPAKARKSCNPQTISNAARTLRQIMATTAKDTAGTQAPCSSSEVQIVRSQRSLQARGTQGRSKAPSTMSSPTAGNDIYVESVSVSCGYQPCRFSANTIKELETHMSRCVYRNSSTWLTCKQCCMPFRTVPELLNDLRSHQTKIYLCGICGYKTDLPHYVKTHMRGVHNLQFEDTKYVQRINADTGRSECVYQPIVPNMRIRISQEGGGGSIIANGPSSLSSSCGAGAGSSAYSRTGAQDLVVADFDAVPRQSIFTSDARCAHCNYSTKVRRNLIRHLAHHKEDTGNRTNNISPSKSFVDSHSTTTSEPNAGLQKLFYPKQVPDYIPLRRRYECSITGCGQLECDGTSYVEHLSSSHPNVLAYSCPHCDDVYDTQSDFIMHIYLHGPHLYKCHYCNYVHNQRHIVLGHCRADHMGVQSCVDTLREEHEVSTGNRSVEKQTVQKHGGTPQKRKRSNGSESLLESSSECEDNYGDVVPLEQQQLSFVCTVCNDFKSYSRSLMRTHLIQELDFESLTCNICEFVAAKTTVMQKHFEMTHAGQTMDFAVSVDPKHEKVIGTLLDAQEAKIRKTKQTGINDNNCNSNTEVSETATEERQERVNEAVTRYFCPSCSFTSKNVTVLKLHLETHLHRQTHTCKICGASFSGLPHLRRHHSVRHNPQPFQEPKKEADIKLDLFIDWVIQILPQQAVDDGHLMRPVILTCQKNDCQMKFSNLKKFSDHFRRHVGDRSLIELDLTKRKRVRHSSSSSTSSTHKPQDEDEMGPLSMVTTVHSDEESTPSGNIAKYLCPYCEFKSKRFHRARDHIMRHYKYKFFQCGYCGVDRATEEELREHCYRYHKDMKVVTIRKPQPQQLTVHKVGFKEVVLVKEMVEEDNNEEQMQVDNVVGGGGRFVCMDCNFSTNIFCNAQYHCQNDHELATCIKIRGENEWNNDSSVAEQRPAHSNELSDLVPVSPQPIDESQECPLCQLVLPDKATWLKHFTDDHQKKYFASPAKERSPNISKGNKVALGIRTSHTKLQGFTYHCKYCPYVGETLSLFRGHWEMLHGHMEMAFERVKSQVTLKCHVCGDTLWGWEKAKEHVNRHAHRFKCGYCPKTSTTERLIHIHCGHKHPLQKSVAMKNTKYAAQRKRLLKNLVVVEIRHMSSTVGSADRPGRSGTALAPPTNVDSLLPKATEVITVEDDDDHNEDATTAPYVPESPISSLSFTSPPSLPALDSPNVIRRSSLTARKSTGKTGNNNKGLKRKREWWWCSPKFQWLMEEFPYGFSYYGNRPEPIDLSSLRVYTHFKGVQNTTVSAVYLSEVFNLFPVVVVEDLMGTKHYS